MSTVTNPSDLAQEDKDAFKETWDRERTLQFFPPNGRHFHPRYMDGPGFDRHEKSLVEALDHTRQAIWALERINGDKNARTRDISITITHLEDALLRINSIAYGDTHTPLWDAMQGIQKICLPVEDN